MEQVRMIEADLEDAASGELDATVLVSVQKRLDVLAEKYQYSEAIGDARYKLYELQALVHYASGDDEGALGFINQAIDMRGDTYARAEKLKTQLLDTTHATAPKAMLKRQRPNKLVGYERWLAVLVVGVSLGIALSAIYFIDYGNLPQYKYHTLDH